MIGSYDGHSIIVAHHQGPWVLTRRCLNPSQAGSMFASSGSGHAVPCPSGISECERPSTPEWVPLRKTDQLAADVGRPRSSAKEAIKDHCNPAWRKSHERTEVLLQSVWVDECIRARPSPL